jgi:hypothetical protein
MVWRVVFVFAHAAWYEFWGQGIWNLGHWSHLHAPWWTWAFRGSFLVGIVLAFLLLLLLSGAFDWFSISFGVLLVAIWAFIPGVTQTLAVLALLAPFMALFVLLWSGVDRLTHGSGRDRISGELARIGLNARVDGSHARVRIALADPFQVGSCKKIVAWEGQAGEALSRLADLPSGCGQSAFLAAFKIAPGGKKFARLASELDRLGVSEARARANGKTAWVEATYDPVGITYTSEVLLSEEGHAPKDAPVEELADARVEFASFDSLGYALAALAPLPDDVGARGFSLHVGEPSDSRPGVDSRTPARQPRIWRA